MSRTPTSKGTCTKPKTVPRLPDLDQARSAVLNSLTSADAQHGDRHAIDEFVEWYCYRSAELSCSVTEFTSNLATRSRDNQSAPGSRAPLGLRGCRLWASKPRFSSRYSTSEGRQKDRDTLGKLAHDRTATEFPSGRSSPTFPTRLTQFHRR